MTKDKEANKENPIANFIGTLLLILCVPLLIVFLTIAIKSNINHDKLPDFLGYKPLICASNSMENIFEVGDVTITKEVLSQEELNEGDIITFWDEDHSTIITHRIDEITTDENNETIYVTKGDMNNEVDAETIKFNQIEGKYVGHVKYIGNLILAIQEPTGLIITFMIPLLIIILVDNHKIKVNDKKMQRKIKALRRLAQNQKSTNI